MLHQVSGSDGRELAPDQEVTITEDKSAHATYGVSITNSLKLGNLEIRKSSEDGIIEGWDFEITRDIDDWSLVVTTGVVTASAPTIFRPAGTDMSCKNGTDFVTSASNNVRCKRPIKQFIICIEV